jgi:hypothetical protein
MNRFARSSDSLGKLSAVQFKQRCFIEFSPSLLGPDVGYKGGQERKARKKQRRLTLYCSSEMGGEIGHDWFLLFENQIANRNPHSRARRRTLNGGQCAPFSGGVNMCQLRPLCINTLTRSYSSERGSVVSVLEL